MKTRRNERVYNVRKKKLNKSKDREFCPFLFLQNKSKNEKKTKQQREGLKLYKINLMLAHAAYHRQLLLATPRSFFLEFSNSFLTIICICYEFEGCVSLKDRRFLKLSLYDHSLPLSFDYLKQNCHLLAHDMFYIYIYIYIHLIIRQQANNMFFSYFSS